MERRQGLLGYLAVGLGVVALVVALSGRFSGAEMGRGYRGRYLPQVAQGDTGRDNPAPVTPPATQAPAQPAAGDFRGYERGHVRGGERGERAWGGPRGFDRGERGPLGLLGGIFPLLAAFLLVGFGFRLFRGGNQRWHGGPWQGGPGQQGNSPWGHTQQGQPQPGPSHAGPQAPPPPSSTPHTGDTRRFDA